jgi:hypothetical protein
MLNSTQLTRKLAKSLSNKQLAKFADKVTRDDQLIFKQEVKRRKK